ncbi:hypothetical protein VNO78_03750 [Psophocarpus tetragonolobus]|uniref:Uncharacterized protein n=1 Tax=Psophocarpus tetragonolobus TaxID=3891 RepID=A0AAN9T4W4_PSOTE
MVINQIKVAFLLLTALSPAQAKPETMWLSLITFCHQSDSLTFSLILLSLLVLTAYYAPPTAASLGDTLLMTCHSTQLTISWNPMQCIVAFPIASFGQIVNFRVQLQTVQWISSIMGPGLEGGLGGGRAGPEDSARFTPRATVLSSWRDLLVELKVPAPASSATGSHHVDQTSVSFAY